MKTNLEKLIADTAPGFVSVAEHSNHSSNKSIRCACGSMMAMMYDVHGHKCTHKKDAANARRLALSWGATPKLVAALGIMTALCRIKYGNLDPDVYAEIEKSEALLAEIEKQAGEL